MFNINVGSTDRVIRSILGVVLIGVYFTYPDASWKWAAMLIGLVLLFTSVMSSCAVYSLLGVRTVDDSDPDST